jgi:DNA-binding response OmpR family regulator
MTWKVLLLDFNVRSAAELGPSLSEAGCDAEVITDRRALTAATTLSQLSSRRCDAVLLSVALPRLAGVGLLDRIHRDTRSRGIPVIIVGSDATLLTWHETKRTPAEGYLRRSEAPGALASELRALLQSVVGAGSRTVPPPPPGSVERAPDAEGTAPQEKLDDDAKKPRTHSRLRLVPAGGGGRLRRGSRTDLPAATTAAGELEPAAPVESDPAARIRHLEAALEKSLERLRDAGRQLEGERASHEDALRSMTAELHAVSVKLGKKLADVTARALAAEERANVEASRASQATAAEQALAAKHQELLEIERIRAELELRLDREIAARREDQQVAVAALRVAEERIASLVAQAPPVPSRRSMPAPDSQIVPSRSPSSSDLFERRSSGPPPVKSGPRTVRPLASFEGDRDDTRLPGCRAMLLIDGDKASRVNTARALARASWEVTVRDSCAGIADVIGTFDIIVTEVAGVGVDELLGAFREHGHACAIVVWTLAVDSARALFREAGIARVTILQKAYRTDDLVAAVQAHLDETPSVAIG